MFKGVVCIVFLGFIYFCQVVNVWAKDDLFDSRFSGVLQPLQEKYDFQKCLLIESVGHYGRSAIHQDAIESKIVDDSWRSPRAGQKIVLSDGRVCAWRASCADTDGWFDNDPALRGGWAYMSIEAFEEKVMILEMQGNSMVYINGVPRIGDRYSYGYVRLPVMLRPWKNEFLFHCSRGRLKARLVAPKSEIMFSMDDNTLPDLILSKPVQAWAAVVIINSTNRLQDDLYIKASLPQGQTTVTKVGRIGPLAVRKVGFEIKGDAITKTGVYGIKLNLMRPNGQNMEILDNARVNLSIKKSNQTQKHTFVSHIDGSVQYFALNPARLSETDKIKPALFLSTHGAAVEAINHANAYSSKTWGHLVAPTNRRPYGFDWEDWGRLDALEVMSIAQKMLQTDPYRTYLTGHSMGGHGAWILGVQYPDKFAAVGPSAGWISFWSYRGAKRYETNDLIKEILMRAEASSDTLTLIKNLKNTGVYILHGSADANVPVSEARTMHKHLQNFHQDFVYREVAGQGHWWDISKASGIDCVDWAEMFDFFDHHRLPASNKVRQIDYATTNPGISAWSHWVGIEAQIKPLNISHVSIHLDPERSHFVGTTNNVSRLSLKLDSLAKKSNISIKLDNQIIEAVSCPDAKQQIWLSREKDKWQMIPEPSRSLKGPHRNGPFKDAFQYRMLFVYGTNGTAKENDWAYAKARFDAEQFWYQGNGSVDIIADSEFEAAKETNRGVILYGNAQTNSAWPKLLSNSPIQIDNNSITIGQRQLESGDLACLFLQPRPDSSTACVAVVGGTGITGMRLTDRLGYIFAGCNYPDCIVIGPEMLSAGVDGVHVAGFFGNDWSVANGDFAWREKQQIKDHDNASVAQVPKSINSTKKSFKNPISKIKPKQYFCYWATWPIDIDGYLDKIEWGSVPWTDIFIDIEGDIKPMPRFRTRAKMLWDDKYFYVAAELEEPHVWGTLTKKNSVIYQDNDFEVFIGADGDIQEYYEFEMNALNTVWNLLVGRPYSARNLEIPGQKSGVKIKGTLNDPSDEDEGWSLEIAFPWQVMEEYIHQACPPQEGDQLRINFSRVEWEHKIKNGKYIKVPGKSENNWVWSPQGVINMHKPETWGYVKFTETMTGVDNSF
jgi:dienelactone hydrolase